jgi:cytidine deaminase
MMRSKPNNVEISEAVLTKLRVASMEAAKRAYCPYSHFPVGAAVLTADGGIFSGCNVENASFGLTICAERNAIFQAVAGGSQQIMAVVIYTPTLSLTAPCGACRQVINEFGPDAEIYSFCNGQKELRISMPELLKHAFGPRNLA